MRVKRFIGENIADTMSKIKRDLGSDAVILQTRQIKEGGFLGFFAKTRVEITAAIEEKALNSSRVVGNTEESYQAVNTDTIKRAYEAYRDKENEYAKEKVGKDLEKNAKLIEHDLLETTQSELREMHSILREIKGHITRDEEDKTTTPEPLEKWVGFLTQRGVILIRV